MSTVDTVVKILKSGVALSLAAYMALPAFAAAQEAQLPVPRAAQAKDPNGVDVLSGSFSDPGPIISVGPESQGLSYRPIMTDRGRWTDNVKGEVVSVCERDPQVDECMWGPVGIYMNVSVGGLASVVFEDTGGGWQPTNGTSSTLAGSSNNWVFTAHDGSIANYALPTLNSYRGTDDSLLQTPLASIQTLQRPSGERLAYHYRETAPGVSVLSSVTNNFGYQLHFEYSGTTDPVMTRAVALNNAVEFCAPTAATCALSGSWPTLTFAVSGAERSVTDSLNRTTVYTIGAPAAGGRPRVLGVRRPTRSSGQDLMINYRARVTVDPPSVERYGPVTQVTTDSGVWTYSNSVNAARSVTVRDPLGHDTYYAVYTLEGVGAVPLSSALAQKTDALGNTTTNVHEYRPGVGAVLTSVTFPEGDKTLLSYDARGNLTELRERSKTPGTPADIVQTLVYPTTCLSAITCNRPTSLTDARGNVTDFTWSATHGGLLTETRPAPTGGAVRPQVRVTYGAHSAWYLTAPGVISQSPTSVWLRTERSSCATSASCDNTIDEVIFTTAYQSGSAALASNLSPVSASAGSGDGSLAATTTTAYDDAGNVLTVDGPLAGTADTTRYVWDAMRQQVGVVGPDPDGPGSRLYPATRTTYDANGQTTMVERGVTPGQSNANWSAFSPLQTATTVYDLQGRKIRDTAATGTADAKVTQYSYDAANRLMCSTVRMNPAAYGALPTSACTLGSEGAFGKDRITLYSYDNADRLLSTTSGYLSGAPIEESQTWTANSKVATRSDGNGNVSTYVYDGFDRVARLRFPNASGGGSSVTDYEEYGYDAADNPTSKRVRSGGVFTTTFDALNRPTFVDAPAGTNDVAYAYDNLDRMTTASIPGQTITRAWDALGRMTSETGPLGAMSYQYDLAGRRTRQTWPDAFFVTNTWSLADEMTAILHAGTTQIIGYSYDNLGRRTGITRGNGVTSAFGYDAASRLTSLSHDVGGADADVTFGYAYNPASQVVSKTTSNNAYVYSPTASETTYANNGLNRVTSVGGMGVSYDANGNITHDAARAFTYDAANRLTGANGGSSTLSYDPLDRLYDYVGAYGGRYLYDGTETVGFATSGTTINTRFIRGPGTDEIVANYVSTGPVPAQYWASDERGSLVNLSNGATGLNTVINTYDDYGQPAPTNLGRLQYTGQLWMPDLGAYHYKARAYQPSLGRFLQTDPVGYKAGLNLYAYVANDPINNTDPTGMQSYFFGGAGNKDNAEYKTDMGRALTDAGIADVRLVPEASTSGGLLGDASLGVMLTNNVIPGDYSTVGYAGVGPSGEGGQYNLMGYSLGAAQAAQQALGDAARGTTVDNLILVGAPLNSSLMDAVMNSPNISNVHVLNLGSQGDPIAPPMSDMAIMRAAPLLARQMGANSGHFYYSAPGAQGAARRDALAAQLYGRGVR